MVFSSTVTSPRKNRTLPAMAALVMAAIISFLNLNFGGVSVSLLWVPLIIVSLWPKDIPALLTIALFLLVGLFIDWGSLGAPGQWAIIYIAAFAILRPDRRPQNLTLVHALRNWVAISLVAIIILILTGYFVYGTWPNFTALARQAGMATLLLPLFFLMRRAMRYMLTPAEDREN